MTHCSIGILTTLIITGDLAEGISSGCGGSPAMNGVRNAPQFGAEFRRVNDSEGATEPNDDERHIAQVADRSAQPHLVACLNQCCQ